MKRKEAQHFFKKLKIQGMVICLPVQNTKMKVCVVSTGDQDVTSRLKKSMVKYITSVKRKVKILSACNTKLN